MIVYPFFFLLALGISWTTTGWLVRNAPRLGLVDAPGPRKVHTQTTPLGGGLALYVANAAVLLVVIAAGWLLESWPALQDWAPAIVAQHASGVVHRTSQALGLLLLATLQMLVGLAEDRRRPAGIGVFPRLAAQILLASLLVTIGISVTLFLPAPLLTAPLTVLWVVGLTNAINLLDNMDGLSSSVSAIACLLLAATQILVGDLFVAGLAITLVGSLCGFLAWNWNPARIFLGDGGAYFLGFWLAALSILGTFNTPEWSHVTVLAPLCLFAVPIYDTASVILIRLRQGRSPFEADKQHFSHRLVDLGLSVRSTVLLIDLVAAVTGLAGVLLFFVRPEGAGLVLVLVAGMLAIIGLLEYVARRQS